MIGEALARALRVRTHAAGDAGGEHLGEANCSHKLNASQPLNMRARQPNGTRKGRKDFGR